MRAVTFRLLPKSSDANCYIAIQSILLAMKIDKVYVAIVLGTVIAVIAANLYMGVIHLPQTGNTPIFTSYMEIVATIAFVIVAVPAIGWIHSHFFLNPIWTLASL
jgi:uncharacterized membrane protein